MGWNDRDPHASRIEAIMFDLESEGMEYPESYDRALELYEDEVSALTDWVLDLYRSAGKG